MVHPIVAYGGRLYREDMVYLDRWIVKRFYRAYNVEGVKIWRGTLEDEEKLLDIAAIHPHWHVGWGTGVTVAAACSRTFLSNENFTSRMVTSSRFACAQLRSHHTN